jgi:hypothetical protein
MALSRRTLLKASAALGGAITLAGGATIVHWWDQAATPGWQCLSEAEQRFLHAFADTVFPPGGEPAIGGSEAGATEVFDAVVGAMAPDQRNALKLFLNALNASTRPTHLSAFDRLEPERRDQVLIDWENHPVSEWRNAIQSLKILVGIGFTTHPEVAAVISPNFLLGYGR